MLLITTSPIIQITDLRYSTEEETFDVCLAGENSKVPKTFSFETSKSRSSFSGKTLMTTIDGNLLAVSSRKSSVSPTTTSQLTIKTNYIEPDDVSATAETSDFVVEPDFNNMFNSTNSTTKKSKKIIKKVLSMSEQVDEFIDQCIEIESNKKIFTQNVNWFTLTFKSNEYETMVKCTFL